MASAVAPAMIFTGFTQRRPDTVGSLAGISRMVVVTVGS
jgi:hypothetical protein